MQLFWGLKRPTIWMQKSFLRDPSFCDLYFSADELESRFMNLLLDSQYWSQYCQLMPFGETGTQTEIHIPERVQMFTVVIVPSPPTYDALCLQGKCVQHLWPFWFLVSSSGMPLLKLFWSSKPSHCREQQEKTAHWNSNWNSPADFGTAKSPASLAETCNTCNSSPHSVKVAEDQDKDRNTPIEMAQDGIATAETEQEGYTTQEAEENTVDETKQNINSSAKLEQVPDTTIVMGQNGNGIKAMEQRRYTACEREHERNTAVGIEQQQNTPFEDREEENTAPGTEEEEDTAEETEQEGNKIDEHEQNRNARIEPHSNLNTNDNTEKEGKSTGEAEQVKTSTDGVEDPNNSFPEKKQEGNTTDEREQKATKDDKKEEEEDTKPETELQGNKPKEAEEEIKSSAKQEKEWNTAVPQGIQNKEMKWTRKATDPQKRKRTQVSKQENIGTQHCKKNKWGIQLLISNGRKMPLRTSWKWAFALNITWQSQNQGISLVPWASCWRIRCQLLWPPLCVCCGLFWS